ncbi:unnamed protein product [Clonostachys rosea f. rosea IK726]|uniref:T6SS Phospholipase effector Tle1-like catalytic domain-containing protein n=2 Tax=Bionectria ochroleuca TaxID=29856 RepID=A0A0B7KC44_BIOOC|nr:unnamed protein product [Clonostachys rosea f. rosea IK726]
MSENCRSCTATYAQGNIKKRLIVCCDGTFGAIDKGNDQYASNVARLSRVISRVGVSDTNNKREKIPQIVYYQSGVGTGAVGKVNKGYQGAVGGGLAENVCEAYNFLANNWGPEDEIFIFGFSRGAYTARSLAGFICEVGLLTPLHLDNFYDVYLAYKIRGKEAFSKTKWAQDKLEPGELGTLPPQQGRDPYPYGSRFDYLKTISHMHVPIKVVGVWDTVGSINATTWFVQAGDDTSFHSTKLHPRIENAFHALAIDETRGNFPPTLWYKDSTCPNVNLKQVWFPGYHSDVGGHSASNIDTNSVDEIAFSWMIDQIHGKLQVSGTALQKYILFRLSDNNFVTTNTKVRDMAAAWSKVQWSDGTLEDTNPWLSIWWISSSVSTLSASYKRVPGETKATENGVEIEAKNFCEEIHPSVYHRVKHWSKDGKRYTPAPFVGDRYKNWEHFDADNKEKARWVKTEKATGKKLILSEYQIPKNADLTGKYKKEVGYDHWEGSLERTFAPKDVLAAQDAL